MAVKNQEIKKNKNNFFLLVDLKLKKIFLNFTLILLFGGTDSRTSNKGLNSFDKSLFVKIISRNEFRVTFSNERGSIG